MVVPRRDTSRRRIEGHAECTALTFRRRRYGSRGTHPQIGQLPNFQGEAQLITGRSEGIALSIERHTEFEGRGRCGVSVQDNFAIGKIDDVRSGAWLPDLAAMQRGRNRASTNIADDVDFLGGL